MVTTVIQSCGNKTYVPVPSQKKIHNCMKYQLLYIYIAMLWITYFLWAISNFWEKKKLYFGCDSMQIQSYCESKQ